ERPRKVRTVIVHGFRPCQCERETAGAERPLLLEELTHERRLLDVARGGGNTLVLQPLRQPDGPVLPPVAGDPQGLFPVGVNAQGMDPWRLDSWQTLQAFR